MKRVKRVLYFLVGLGLVYVLVCFQAARGYIRPPRKSVSKPAWVQEVDIPTAAGLDPAWATPKVKSGHIVFVLAHGYGGTRGTWSELMRKLPEHGIEAVAPAMPGQDASPEHYVGFGVKESQVIVDTVRWIREHSAQRPKIVLMGLSMGGAASWIASSMDPSVSGVVTEGAFARLDEATETFFDSKLKGGHIVLKPVIWFASGMTGLQPSTIVPLNQAKRWKGRPALVIQGAADTLIPMDHARRLAEASGAPLWIVPGAQHAHCYDMACDEYVKRLVEFANNLK